MGKSSVAWGQHDWCREPYCKLTMTATLAEIDTAENTVFFVVGTQGPQTQPKPVQQPLKGTVITTKVMKIPLVQPAIVVKEKPRGEAAVNRATGKDVGPAVGRAAGKGHHSTLASKSGRPSKDNAEVAIRITSFTVIVVFEDTLTQVQVTPASTIQYVVDTAQTVCRTRAAADGSVFRGWGVHDWQIDNRGYGLYMHLPLSSYAARQNSTLAVLGAIDGKGATGRGGMRQQSGRHGKGAHGRGGAKTRVTVVTKDTWRHRDYVEEGGKARKQGLYGGMMRDTSLDMLDGCSLDDTSSGEESDTVVDERIRLGGTDPRLLLRENADYWDGREASGLFPIRSEVSDFDVLVNLGECMFVVKVNYFTTVYEAVEGPAFAMGITPGTIRWVHEYMEAGVDMPLHWGERMWSLALEHGSVLRPVEGETWPLGKQLFDTVYYDHMKIGWQYDEAEFKFAIMDDRWQFRIPGPLPVHRMALIPLRVKEGPPGQADRRFGKLRTEYQPDNRLTVMVYWDAQVAAVAVTRDYSIMQLLFEATAGREPQSMTWVSDASPKPLDLRITVEQAALQDGSVIRHVKTMRVYKHLGFLNAEPLRMTAFLQVGGKVFSTEVNG